MLHAFHSFLCYDYYFDTWILDHPCLFAHHVLLFCWFVCVSPYRYAKPIIGSYGLFIIHFYCFITHFNVEHLISSIILWLMCLSNSLRACLYIYCMTYILHMHSAGFSCSSRFGSCWVIFSNKWKSHQSVLRKIKIYFLLLSCMSHILSQLLHGFSHHTVHWYCPSLFSPSIVHSLFL